MSTVHNQQRDESIYNLIPQIPEKHVKPPKHQSNFRSTVKQETRAGKACHKTMGPASYEVNTKEYLKKHALEPVLPETEGQFRREDCLTEKKAEVPRPDEKPVMGLKTNKNFVTTNAVENIMSAPKKPSTNFVDTKKGDTHPLEPSGLQPMYRKKKDFGEVPKYIVNRKNEVAQAQQEYDNYVQEHYRRGAMKKLSEEERLAILNGLKSNWEELHHLYQGLSVVTDTGPKKAKKERMEAEMKQLEKDIETIERHGCIYIGNN